MIMPTRRTNLARIRVRVKIIKGKFRGLWIKAHQAGFYMLYVGNDRPHKLCRPAGRRPAKRPAWRWNTHEHTQKKKVQQEIPNPLSVRKNNSNKIRPADRSASLSLQIKFCKSRCRFCALFWHSDSWNIWLALLLLPATTSTMPCLALFWRLL